MPTADTETGTNRHRQVEAETACRVLSRGIPSSRDANGDPSLPRLGSAGASQVSGTQTVIPLFPTLVEQGQDEEEVEGEVSNLRHGLGLDVPRGLPLGTPGTARGAAH